MKADRSGTHTEQLRASHNWRSAGRTSQTRCEHCEHLYYPETDARRGSPRCRAMTLDPHARREDMRHVATRLTAVCDDWRTKPEPARMTPRERLLHLRRRLCDPSLSDGDRAALSAEEHQLAAAMGGSDAHV
jgi:hypothetical protein